MVARCLAGVFVVLCCSLAQVTPASAQEVARGDLVARFDALAEGFMATQAVPGAIGALVVGDQVILRGWGHADTDAGISAGPDDVRFEIGAISKLFTWLAVMMLVEEGALDLQADVADYLVETPVPGDDPLTLALLMGHRPGLEDSFALFDPAIGALPRPQALAASAPAQVFPRGAVTAYSNWGVALAGQIVEDVTSHDPCEVHAGCPCCPSARGDWPGRHLDCCQPVPDPPPATLRRPVAREGTARRFPDPHPRRDGQQVRHVRLRALLPVHPHKRCRLR